MRTILLCLSLLSLRGLAQDTTAIRYSKAVTAADLSEYLHKLASDEFEGRETGQKGQKLAAEYIASQFSKSGIPALHGGSSYFQDIPLIIKKAGKASIVINGKSFEFLKDFYFFPGFDDTSLSLDSVLFMGYGIKDKNYSDYDPSIQASGKALLILEGEPFDAQGNSLVSGSKEKSDWAGPMNRKKLTGLKELSPKLVLIVADSLEKRIKDYGHYIETPTMKLNMEGSKPKQSYPLFFISEDMANHLLKKSHNTITSLKKKISTSGKSSDLTIPVPVKAEVKRESEELTAQNVLGYIEGTDLKNELVVVTGHYDHLGRDGNKIYYGADDDGSGTSAVIELAKVFAKAKKEGHGPRRSMLFMTVAGEEKGLLGSEYYSSRPVFPLASTVADLNIDMIGRVDEKHKDNPNYIYVIGSDKLSTELHKINETANSTYTKLELDYTYNEPNDPNRFYYRSDHYNFAKHNIPIIFYFNGVHADYHKATDTVDKIDFQKMEKISRLVFFTAWELANRTERIKVDVANDFKNDR